jgi:hypothetical protein
MESKSTANPPYLVIIIPSHRVPISCIRIMEHRPEKNSNMRTRFNKRFSYALTLDNIDSVSFTHSKNRE